MVSFFTSMIGSVNYGLVALEKSAHNFYDKEVRKAKLNMS